MKDDTIFDFPCSTTFRDAYREQRRPNLPACGSHSDEQEMLDYIHALEDENHRLRLALDLSRLMRRVKTEELGKVLATRSGIVEADGSEYQDQVKGLHVQPR
jgi:hypothetical protein